MPFDRQFDRLVNFNFMPTNTREEEEENANTNRWSGKREKSSSDLKSKFGSSGDFTFTLFFCSLLMSHTVKRSRKNPSDHITRGILNATGKTTKAILSSLKKTFENLSKPKQTISETKTDEMSWRSLEMSFTSCFVCVFLDFSFFFVTCSRAFSRLILKLSAVAKNTCISKC